MSKDITLDVSYDHPIDKVWRALTDRDALSTWLMPTDFEPEVGRRFQFTTEPAPGFDGIVDCEVLELDAPRLMRWSWRGGPIDTEVLFRLEPEGERRTRLRFVQSGFAGAKASLVRAILSSGARRIYRELLPAYLDGGAKAVARCRQHNRWPGNVIARIQSWLPSKRGAASKGRQP